LTASRQQTKRLTLALQGGGTHGAFTWGVLDRLLEDKRITIEGVSGTSAGALNAAVMADGYDQGGAAGAQRSLDAFWEAMSHHGAISPYHSGPFNPLGADFSPFAIWFDWISQLYSPYQLNPFNINPLRRILSETIDFERLRTCTSMKLFVAATNVRTNHLRVFSCPELTVDVLMASTCLPQMHHAVEVDGEYYWDGGFMGNPVLEPLVDYCESHDIIIIQVNPTTRPEVPWTGYEIDDRINEITFNSSLMREIRFIAVISKLVERGIISHPRYDRVLFHLIQAEEALRRFSARSKLDTSRAFLVRLKQLGRETAETWLAGNYDALGRRSTLDMTAWEPVENRREFPDR
jgi:NTE family protein